MDVKVDTEGEISYAKGERSRRPKEIRRGNLSNDEFDDFDSSPENLLGAGGFGQVFKAKWKSKKIDVAIKTLDFSSCTDEHELKQACCEVRIQCKFRHENILRLIDHFRKEGIFHFVLEYCPGGSLWSQLLQQEEGYFQEREAAHYVSQIAAGLEHLHSKNIIHRDIKLDNILIGSDGFLKIADFGVSVFLRARDKKSKKAHGICGTHGYMPPEMIEGKGYNTKADIWSLGVVCCELVMGYDYTPFYYDSEDEQMNQEQIGYELIRKNELQELQEEPAISRTAKDLIFQLTQTEPGCRLSAKNLREHPWFTIAKNVHDGDTNSGHSISEDDWDTIRRYGISEDNFDHFYHEQELLNVFKMGAAQYPPGTICQNDGRYLLEIFGGSYVLLRVHDGDCYLKMPEEARLHSCYAEVCDLKTDDESLKKISKNKFGPKWKGVQKKIWEELLSINDCTFVKSDLRVTFIHIIFRRNQFLPDSLLKGKEVTEIANDSKQRVTARITRARAANSCRKAEEIDRLFHKGLQVQ
jgi:serine/threonine protein kinase